MPRGRKPLPTHLKVLQGTARPDRRNAAEPTPPAGPPDPPEYLDVEARKEWDRISPILTGMNLLTKADGPSLGLYCAAYSRMRRADAEVARIGVIVRTPAGGLKRNPHVEIAQQARAEMLRILTEFGLTPSSRSRVKAEIAPPRDELTEYLERCSRRSKSKPAR